MKLITLLFFLPAIINIELPQGFKRTQTNSFGDYLRSISLKSDKTVYLYNGEKKGNQTAQYAVLDISIGNENLQQCADAAMRLRAEWLFKTKLYDKIVFNSVSGEPLRFTPPYNYIHLMKHMKVVFGFCNSWSLEKQLKKKSIMDIQVGDVLIKGGFPGHVVMVVDMVVNRKGEKLMMLAQSYMPAQDIHILKGPINEAWYPVKEGQIITPQWTFNSGQVKTW
jgi:hypothetical protein